MRVEEQILNELEQKDVEPEYGTKWRPPRNVDVQKVLRDARDLVELDLCFRDVPAATRRYVHYVLAEIDAAIEQVGQVRGRSRKKLGR